ncbi:MAG: TIGR01458 family HAD-type hydrolase [Gammaproteobacteria bacterium]
MDRKLTDVDAVLFDLDGVLYVGDEVIEGATRTLEQVRAAGLVCRFITNTSTRLPHSVGAKLRGMGFPIRDDEIFSVVTATRDVLATRGCPSVHLLVGEEVRPFFSAFPESPEPECVVVGDIGAAWNYTLLNRVFNELMAGAELLAMHRNRYWQAGNGLRMDIGAFVSGLEYVSGKAATVVGKPSTAFFSLAVKSAGVPEGRVLMVVMTSRTTSGGRNGRAYVVCWCGPESSGPM